MPSLRDAFRSFLDHWQDDLSSTWGTVIGAAEPNLAAIGSTLTLEANEIIFPGRKSKPAPGARSDAHIFRALDQIDPSKVRAVVLGQDPYPKSSRATGRAFEQGDLAEVEATIELDYATPDTDAEIETFAPLPPLNSIELDGLTVVDDSKYFDVLDSIVPNFLKGPGGLRSFYS